MKDTIKKVLTLKPLDKHIVHAALIEARRLMACDLTVNEAAEQACPGAWYTLRQEVARRLSEERRLTASVARLIFNAA